MKQSNVYSLYHSFQSIYTLVPYHLGAGHALPPLRYNLHPTFRCNLRCPYCYIANPADRTELDTQTWLDFIDRIPKFSVVTFSGGEVTLRKDFKAILEKGLEKSATTFLTNGVFNDDELLDLSVARRLFLMGISLDGVDSCHDDIRRLNGAFDQATRNLHTLQEKKGKKKYPLVDIKTVILQENLENLEALYQYAHNVQAEFLTLSFLKGCTLQFNPILEDAFSPKFHEQEYPVECYFDMPTFKRVYRRLVEFSNTTPTQLRFYPEFSPQRGEAELARIEAYFTGEKTKPVEDTYHKCLSPWTDLSVMANGDCFPCLSYRIGNIKDTPALKIWNNEKYVEFRKCIQKKGVISSCQGCCYAKLK